MSSEMVIVTLPPPAADQAHMDVSALEAGNINLSTDKLVADTEPEAVSCPSLAFFLRHSKTGFQIVFDLGMRRDFEGYPPATQKRTRDVGFSPTVKQTVAESLEKGGVAPHEVDAVIVSHLHWDQYVTRVSRRAELLFIRCVQHWGPHPVHKGDVYRRGRVPETTGEWVP